MFQLDAVQGHARGSVRPGVQIHEILNFYSAALLLGSEVSWSPEGSEAKLGGESGVVVKKVLIAANLKMDGMLLGQGGAVHTGFQEVLGFVNPVKADEAERVLQMSDADREAWNAGNPLVSEHVEWMLTTANGAASGHCAFYFERKGGGWERLGPALGEPDLTFWDIASDPCFLVLRYISPLATSRSAVRPWMVRWSSPSSIGPSQLRSPSLNALSLRRYQTARILHASLHRWLD